MPESNGTEVQPIRTRDEGWKSKQQGKRTFVSSKEAAEQKAEESSRKPLPLPFGKIDVMA